MGNDFRPGGALVIMAVVASGCNTPENEPVADEAVVSLRQPLSLTATVGERQPNVRFGGRSVAGTVSRSDASVAFVATDSGGVFRTGNAGATWSFVSGLPQTRMADVKIDPRNAGVVIATTHDDDHLVSQAGIWRSIDGGSTWSTRSLTVPGCPRYSAEGIAFAPDLDDVFVGIRCNSNDGDAGFRQGGVAVSRDQGVSWTFLDLGMGLGALVAQAAGIVDVYGSAGHRRSIDRGTSFGPLHTAIPGTNFGLAVNSMSVSPLNPSVLFATTVSENDGVNAARLFESDNGGLTWRELPNPQLAIARQPSVATRLVSQQVKIYFGNGLLTFRQTCTGTSPVGSCSASDGARPWESLDVDHSDPAGVVFGPTGSCPLFLLGDSGVSKTADPNCLGPWTTIPAGSTGFNALQIYEVASQVHPSHLDLYFGTQDNELWASPDGGATWPGSFGPEGGLFQLVHSTPNDTDPGNFVTFNAIFSNVRMTPHMGQQVAWSDAPQSLGFSPVLIEPNVYIQWTIPAPGHFVLNITSNASASWSVVSGSDLFDVPGEVTRQTFIAGPASNPVVYQPVPRADGTLGLVKIVNVRSAHATVTRIDQSLADVGSHCEVFYCPVPAFGADPRDPNHLIVADEGAAQMKVSRDGGGTWVGDSALTSAVVEGGVRFSTPAGASGRAGGVEARVISFNPSDGRQIVVGTLSNGVIASGDGGITWFRINGSRQIPNITALAWDEVRHNIIVSTFGRGLWNITDHDAAGVVARCHDVIVNAGSSCTASVSSSSVNDGSFDPDGGTVSCVLSPSGPFRVGSTAVTLVCTDSQGETASCTARVHVGVGDNPSCCPAGTHRIVGTSASDRLTGTSGSDCIVGLGGNDTIDGLGGNDFISGGAGNDTIAGGFGDDLITGGSGDDTIDGGPGNDKVGGNSGRDTITAGPGDDVVDGGPDTDTCFAAPGNDVVLMCEII